MEKIPNGDPELKLGLTLLASYGAKYYIELLRNDKKSPAIVGFEPETLKYKLHSTAT